LKAIILAVLTLLSHDLIVAVKVTAYLVETIVLIGGEEKKELINDGGYKSVRMRVTGNRESEIFAISISFAYVLQNVN